MFMKPTAFQVLGKDFPMERTGHNVPVSESEKKHKQGQEMDGPDVMNGNALR